MAVSFTVPLPVPDAPLDTLSHDVSLLAAVHVHQLLVVTVTVAVSPGDASAALAGEIVNAHDAACCDAVKVWPPIVTVALRAGPLFAAADTVTAPSPVPDAPLVTVSHVSLLAAVHVHQLPAVTEMVAVPPSTVKVVDPGEIAKLHDAGACDTVTRRPAIATVASRAAPVFAAVDTATVPDPLPDAPLVTVNQVVSLLAAVHEQFAPVDTENVSTPPSGPTG
jgi:hypothetical protein